ncbi:MAG: DUF1826 domain-containing protein [Myxococcota bacterium]
MLEPRRDAQPPDSALRTTSFQDVFALRGGRARSVVVERSLSSPLLEASGRLTAGLPFELRYTLDTEDADEVIAEGLFAPLPATAAKTLIQRDALCLAILWSALTGVRHCRATLAVVGDSRCTKLHTDAISLRALCTYAGPGTVIAPGSRAEVQASASPRTVQAGLGDFVFLAGDRWPGGGAMHRSPALEDGQRRLLLVVDEGIRGSS